MLLNDSSENKVYRNTFEMSCGDPIRIRDASNDNQFFDNTFTGTAQNALYTEWYCDRAVQSNCTKQSPECPPLRNNFKLGGATITSGSQRTSDYANLHKTARPASNHPAGGGCLVD